MVSLNGDTQTAYNPGNDGVCACRPLLHLNLMQKAGLPNLNSIFLSQARLCSVLVEGLRRDVTDKNRRVVFHGKQHKKRLNTNRRIASINVDGSCSRSFVNGVHSYAATYASEILDLY